MSCLVAITGKGGTGKSTIAASLTRILVDKSIRPVLAVDADPNSTLAPLLGVKQGPSISDIREEMLESKKSASSVPKERLLKMKLEECIVEASGFDLLSMGRPEGQHCYCYVNSLLRQALSVLRKNYKVVIVDNEAGMEHLSRMNTDDIDTLLVVSEPTVVGARAASKISSLVGELRVTVRRRVLVWNKMTSPQLPPGVISPLQHVPFDDILYLPFDERVAGLAALEETVFSAVLPKEFDKLADVCASASADSHGRSKGKP